MPYSTLYAFEYPDSKSEFQFAVSRHNLIIFDCTHCKNAKISNVFAHMNVMIDALNRFLKYSVFASLFKIEDSSMWVKLIILHQLILSWQHQPLFKIELRVGKAEMNELSELVSPKLH